MSTNYARTYPKFWLCYFWLLVALLAINAVAVAFAAFGGKGSLSKVIGLALSTAGMWPLYGYVRQVRVDPRWLWRVLFAISGVGIFAMTLILLFMLVRTSEMAVLGTLLLLLALASPDLFAQFQYLHRSPDIWRTQRAPA